MNKSILLATIFEKGSYPKTMVPEVTLCGRSNCGKSSFLNAILGIKGVARVSSKPGKTASINFYNLSDKLVVTDLPGYGYAKANWELREKWKILVEDYIFNREQLKLAIILADVRRGIEEEEIDLINLFMNRGVKVLIVLTKTDKLSNSALLKTKVDTLAQISNLWQDMKNRVFFTSSLKKTGITEVKKVLEGIVKIR